MALTPAEKMRAYRERQKANNQKPVSFLLDADIAETIISYAEQHQTTQTDIFNDLLRQAINSNKLPINDTATSYQEKIDRLNAMAENCFQCSRWTGERCEQGLILKGVACNDLELWRVVNNDNLNRIEELKGIVSDQDKELTKLRKQQKEN